MRFVLHLFELISQTFVILAQAFEQIKDLRILNLLLLLCIIYLNLELLILLSKDIHVVLEEV